MTPIRLIAALGIVAALSACSAPQLTMRNAPFEATAPRIAAEQAPTPALATPTLVTPDMPQVPAAPVQQFKIVDYAIKVPESLTVSEANLYYPVADIVWRGDDFGNRKEQVGKIFQTSLTRAIPQVTGPRAVKVDIVVNRFHSLTEKTRYTVGGTHSLSFYLTVRDAQTGAVLVNARKVKADLEGFGGRRAMEAERQGLDMKERIQAHLARVIAAELTLPGGWRDQKRQLARATDQI